MPFLNNPELRLNCSESLIHVLNPSDARSSNRHSSKISTVAKAGCRTTEWINLNASCNEQFYKVGEENKKVFIFQFLLHLSGYELAICSEGRKVSPICCGHTY
jgi:hypothetical protein